MTEERLRQILAAWFKVDPQDITDETCVGNPAAFDSLAVMNLVMTAEAEMDRIRTDDEIASLTSWPAIKAIMLDAVTPSFYKALVLDADGTLWQGIAAEGGVTVTDPFLDAQAVYRSLGRRGVLLAMATKNEPGEVEAVLRTPECFLDPEDFVMRSEEHTSELQSRQ